MIIPRSSAHSGSTRIELAAVAAGIVVLGMLALPALGEARAKSLRTLCVDNLRVVGSAFRLFARDHGDQYPMNVIVFEGGSAEYVGSNPTSTADLCWRHYVVLSNYFDSAGPRFLVCPTDPGRYAATNFAELELRTNARNASLSYGLGPLVFRATPVSLQLLAADRSLEGGQPKFVFNGAAVRGNIGTNVPLLQSLRWSTNGMHRGAGNAIVVDGSVRQWSTRDLRNAMANSDGISNNYMQPGRGPGL